LGLFCHFLIEFTAQIISAFDFGAESSIFTSIKANFMRSNFTRYSFFRPVPNVFKLLAVITCLGISQVSAQTTLISPTGDGGFESGSTFTANGWTVVNGATNQWFVGSTATASAGNNSAYISDNTSGTTYNYSTSSSSTVHIYRDVTFPTGETNIVLSFKWKGYGEGNYDYLTVYSMPTSVTPVVNTPAGGSSSWLNIPTSYSGAVVHCSPQNLNLQSSYQTQTICLPSSYAGTTRRLVFMWSNDGSVGTQPPGSIDEISLVTSVPSAPTNSPTSLSMTAFPGYINGSFTAASGGADGYLVVRYPAGATPVNPVNGTTYSAGGSLGTGKIVSAGSSTSFTAIGLVPSTSYDFYVYSYNSLVCASGPFYKTTSPLFGNKSTLSCSTSGPSGTISVGPSGTYSSITSAMSATSNGITGNVIFELQPTYSSSVETFPITLTNNACVTTQTITVRPQSAATGLSITSSNTTATIDLNGANNIIFDGRPGGSGTTSQLTISNTSTTSGVAVRFINDAVNNTVNYCSVTGSTTSLGVITFSTGVVTGNDNNTISNSGIGSAAGNLPLNAVYSLGLSSTVDNSNNTISGNNIFDYFNASSASNGLNINSFNSGWTITNNRFYQTGDRISTSANTHTAINIASGEGYTITGNIIGFANASGTGTTNLIGNSAALAGFPGSYVTSGTSNSTRFTGINCSFNVGGITSSIQNNTIAGFALYTSSSTSSTTGMFCGIAVNSGSANIGTVTGNTIGSTAGTGSIYAATTTTAGAVVGIYATSANTINIRNNSIGAIDASGTSSSISGGITAINTAGSANCDISSNTIGNSTNPNLRMGYLTDGSGNLSNASISFASASGTATFTGILNSASGNVLMSGNTIRNASANTTSSGSAFRGINNSAGTVTITGNAINNITSACANTTVSTALLAGVGILNQGGNSGSVITLNTINTLSLTNTTTSGTNIAGIALSNVVIDITRNKIYDLANASTSTSTTAPGTASGIFIRSGTSGVNENIFNNMISLGNGQTTNTSFIGIWGNHGSSPNPNDILYYNTINIEGAVSSGAQPSFGYHRGNFATSVVNAATVDIRNNVFNNTRSGGTGKHYAIGNYYNATASATGWGTNASNYNVLNSASSTTIGYWSADKTFSTWQTASASDANSVSGVTVSFVNAPTGDLHVSFGTTATRLESGGTIISTVTTDYDNQTRPGPAGSINGGGCAPDIGADEFDGVMLDVVGPTITYTPLGITSCFASGTRVLSGVTITDCSNVNTTVGTKPRVYYRKSTDANTYAGNTSSDNGWKYVEASNSSSPFSFTIDYTKLQAAVAAGDVIQYFVVAQDIAGTPNVGINSGTFTTTPSSVALTSSAFPIGGTINSYNIVSTGLSGSITIGASGNYTSLTGTSGLFNAINSVGMAGAATVTIIDPSVTETGSVALNTISNSGCTAGTVPLVIKPAASVNATLTGSVSSGPLIKINGATDVTIDGSNNSSTSRNLTIVNTATTAPTAISLANPGTGAGVKNIIIKNCAITTGVATSIGYGIAVGGSTPGTSGADNDNITIQNDSITVAPIGIFASGTTSVSAGGDDSLNITGNVIDYNGTLASIGIEVANAVNSSVSLNAITEQTSASQAPTGISLETGFVSSTVSRNNISKSLTSSTGGYGGRGITVGTGTATSNLTISNNFISGVNGSNWSGFSNSSSMGIAIGMIGNSSTITTTAGGINIYNNSVSMTGSMNTGSTSNITAALYVGSGASALDIRNNIFSNTQVATSTTQKNYAIYAAGANTAFTTINNNDYDVSNSFNTSSAIVGFLSSDRTTLANWQSASGQDALSTSAAAIFTSTSDLHLVNTAGANWCLNGTGATIASVTTDIDAQTRSTPPDMGADEFVAVDNSTVTPSTQTICSGTSITTIAFAGTANSFSWTRNNTTGVTGIAASGTGNITGTLTNTTSAPITVTFTVTPLNANGCPFGTTYTASVVVNPVPDVTTSPLSQTICTGAAIASINNTGSVTGTVFNWTRDNTATVTGIAANGTGTSITGSLTNTTGSAVPVVFTVTPSYTNAGTTCTGTAATATVTVNPNNTVTLTSAAGTNAQALCINTPITNITYTTTGATGATISGLPAGVTGSWAANVVTITGTPSVSGTFNYTVTLTGGCGTTTATGTITVTPNNTVALSSAVGTNAQTLCINTALTNITYATTGATGATFSGLPAGVTGTWAANTVTISGTPTVSGAFNYTVTLTGGCGTISAIGTISVTPNNTITLTSAPATTSQAICVNTPITNITYATTTATGASFSGLPAGVTGSWSGNVATISGSPTVSGTFNYTVTLTGGCSLVTATGTISVTSANTISLTSAAGTNSQTLCINNPITNITYATTGATGATVTGLPTGVTGSWAANVVTITGTPSVSGTFNYTVSMTGGCGAAITATGTIVVNPNNTATLSSAASTANQTLCISTPITNITYTTTGATGATFSGLPTGVNGSWASNTVTISGTPSVSGTFSYTVTLTGGCGTTTASGTITVNPNNAITLTSGTGTNVQTVCINTPVSNITYSTAGGTGATFSGLPSGVTGTWAANVVTISGTPTVSGTFNYTVTLTGGPGCGGAVSATGTITVTPNNTITLTSAAATTNQTLCINTPITNITYSTTGATGATFSGLPVGVIGVRSGNTITISGTPSVSGTFSYTVTLTGGCGNITATGTINVNPNNTITLTSGAGTNTQTKCINTPITNITYATTGATGATITGLPAGVTGSWASNVYTISGTPTVAGAFNYTITLTGGCGTTTTTGTIIVNPLNTLTLTSASSTVSQTRCQNTAITTITYATTGASGATVTGLPSGVTGTWAGNVVTISGTPITSGTYSYTVTLTGGCGIIAATGTIVVNPLPFVTISPTTAVSICSGAGATLTASGATTYTWSPAAGLSATSGAVVTATPSLSTTYTVTGTDGNGCVNTASRLVTVLGLPTVTVSGSTATLCPGSSVTLTANGAVTYVWTPSATLSSGTGSVVTATPPVTTTYTITGTAANGCTNTTTRTVNVYPTPSSAISPAGYVNICQYDSITLTAGAGYVSYKWMIYGTTIAPATGNTLTTGTGGFYTLKVTDTNGCSTTTSQPTVITVIQRPVPTITMNGLTLVATPGFVSYKWYLNGTPITGATAPTYTPLQGGIYKVEVWSDTVNNCPGMSQPYQYTAVGVNTNAIADQIKMYPNPTSDIVKVEAPVPVNIIITGVDGKVVFTDKDVKQFSVGTLPDGVYQVILRDKSGAFLKTEKLTKLSR
jgi:hypothetical protein